MIRLLASPTFATSEKSFGLRDHPTGRRLAPLHAEGQDAAEAAVEVLLRASVARMRREAGVADPGDGGVTLEVPREGERVLGVAPDPEVQRLEPLQEEERVEGGDAGAEVAEEDDAKADGVGRVPEELREAKGRGTRAPGRRRYERKRGAFAKSKRPAVHDDAADGRPVAADPLRGGVDDDVGAVLDRPAEERRGEGVVDDERDAGRVGDLREGLEVGDVELRVSDRLDVDGARRVVDGGGDGRPVVDVDEARRDAEARQRVREEGVRAAVERRGGDDRVAGLREVQDRERLGGLAARRRDGGDARPRARRSASRRRPSSGS